MPVPNRDPSQNKYPEQYMQNTSYDEDFGVNTVEGLSFDGAALTRLLSDFLAKKITVSGDYTYIGMAPPGTAQGSSAWAAFRIDSSVAGTTVFTWADGNASFDNVATDLTALSYS